METQQDYLRRIVRRRMDVRLRSVMEPEDVVQEVMIATYRSLGHVDFPSERTFRRWLGVLAQNRLIDLMRRHFYTARRSSDNLSLDETVGHDESGGSVRVREQLPNYDPGPSTIVSRREAAEALEAVLARIPAQYRELIRLLQVERLPTREIATRLGKKPEAVRSMLSRALSACRQVILQGELEREGLQR